MPVRHDPVAPQYVSQADAARLIGVTDRTIRAMIADERLPAYRLGAKSTRTIRIRLADIEAMLSPVVGGQRGAGAA